VNVTPTSSGPTPGYHSLDPAYIAQVLGPARREGSRWRTTCPNCGHDNLTIGAAEDGKLLVYCWSGCGQRQVLKALGRLNLWPAPAPARNGYTPTPTSANGHRPAGAPAALDPLAWLAGYCGVDRATIAALPIEVWDGCLAFTFPGENAKLRQSNSRDIRWRLSNGASRPALWPLPSPGEALPEHIALCESETDCIVARHLGLPAYACTAGASTALKPHEAEALRRRGVRRVTLLYDADEAGRHGVHKQAEVLTRAGVEVWVADLARADLVDPLSGGKDLRDAWRAAQARGERPEALRQAILAAARPWVAPADASGAVGGPLPAAPSGADLAFRTPLELLDRLGDGVAWAWQGFIATEAVTLFAGREKSGKSTFLCALMRHLLTGAPFLGRPCTPSRVLWCTEESSRSIAEKCIRFGLSGPTAADRMRVLTREAASAVSGARSRERNPGAALQRLVDAAVAEAVRLGWCAAPTPPTSASAPTPNSPSDTPSGSLSGSPSDTPSAGPGPAPGPSRGGAGCSADGSAHPPEPVVLIIDSLAFWAHTLPEEENDASSMTATLRPLVAAAGQRLAVVAVHHMTKASGEVRGSSALPATADIVVTYTRSADSPTRRRLAAVGRFVDTPAELLIEYDANATPPAYRLLGSPSEASQREVMQRIVAALPSVPASLSLTDEADSTSTEYKRWSAVKTKSKAPPGATTPTPTPTPPIGRTQAEVAAVTGLGQQRVAETLARLVAAGEVVRTGSGRRGDPFRYYRRGDAGER
jgi:hypothetical protein